MENIDNKLHKIEGNTVLYFNGEKWLIRESFISKEEAEKFLKEKNLNYGE